MARDLSVQLTTAPGTGNNRQFSLVVNGTATALTCPIGGGGTTCTAPGSVSVSVPAGSTLSIEDQTLYNYGAAPADALFAFRLAES